jgi:hypothetical protein
VIESGIEPSAFAFSAVHENTVDTREPSVPPMPAPFVHAGCHAEGQPDHGDGTRVGPPP